MRAYLFLWVAIAGISAVMAAPIPPAPSAKDRQQLRAEGQRFAQQLQRIIAQVVAGYVRPVSREDLMTAALIGLHQAARKPVPHDLRTRVRQAVAMSALLQMESPEVQINRRPSQDPCERLLVQIRERLGDAEALAGQDAMVICCKAIVPLLDPHSGIVTPDEQSRAMAVNYETFGPGLELQESLGEGPLVVEAVQLGGPAQRAGLRPGDAISHIDGQPVAKAQPPILLALRNQRILAEASPLAPSSDAGPARTEAPPATFRVRYRRPGETEDRHATLLRERFRPETVPGVKRRDNNAWNYVLDEKQKIAHVRVTSLSRGTADELCLVLTDLKRRKVRGLILDLRWCPGGYLDEAVDTADLFMGAGLIATVKARGQKDVPYLSRGQNPFRDFTTVVLVNGDTSGGAELIAAALQDHHQAVIVGQRTRGKGSVQTFSLVGGDIRFKLTSGTFLRPSGKNLHRFPDSKASDDWGVVPDEDCRVSAELGKRLKQWWQEYSLRPATSRERLMLDDPRADPQQLAARAVLRKRLERKKVQTAGTAITPERPR